MSPARALSAGMALLFLGAAVVQWNDPDPLLWMGAYAAAAALALLHAARDRVVPPAALLLGIAFGAGAAWLSPSLLEASSDAYTQIAMQDAAAEEAREALGLWIAAAYAVWLGLRGRRAALSVP